MLWIKALAYLGILTLKFLSKQIGLILLVSLEILKYICQRRGNEEC